MKFNERQFGRKTSKSVSHVYACATEFKEKDNVCKCQMLERRELESRTDLQCFFLKVVLYGG